MDKKEKIKCLVDAGLSLNESKVLLWLLRYKKGVCRRIEREEVLRQPEISVIMNKFEKGGWVIHKNIKKVGKGRPEKEYTIRDEKSIFNTLISSLEKKQNDIVSIIEKLRKEW